MNAGDGQGINTTCAETTFEERPVFLDLYIMLDQSGSMMDVVEGGKTKWEAVTSALSTFVTGPDPRGLSVGIQYFGLPPKAPDQCKTLTCYKDSDCGPDTCGPCVAVTGPTAGFCAGFDTTDSCTPSDYATPEVEIAALPDNGPALVASMVAHTPRTSTPTKAALAGALQHAEAWALAHPDHVVAAVLATDGTPNECDTDQSHLRDLSAKAATESPRVLTFTLGVFTDADLSAGAKDKLDDIANAGLTKQAYVIQTSHDVATEVLAALDAIRDSVATCSFSVPTRDGGPLDVSSLDVQLASDAGPPLRLSHVASHQACPPSGVGFYIDNAQVVLCPVVCNTLTRMDGRLSIAVGCPIAR